MDLIELPITPSKYRYILVIKCALTKWIEMRPLRSKEAKEIAEALFEDVFCRHGSIEIMVSDNGTEFVNHTLKQFHELLLTKRLTTTPYNPQSNGAVEIFNRTLADMLYANVNANQNTIESGGHSIARASHGVGSVAKWADRGRGQAGRDGSIS
jgi:transposase InsO family protein